MLNDCVFCEIAAGGIPATKVFENDKVLAFKDINPQAPVHIVIIPKEHIPSADFIDSSNADLVAECFKAIPVIAAAEGLVNGYRVINNCGADGGQTVPHLHFHLLGGTAMSDKMI